MKLLRFEPSKTKHKKYDAILLNEQTKRTKRVPFGDTRYEQYKDQTGLGKFTHKNHLDKQRRQAYHKRHASDKKNKFSAGYFAAKYLW